MLGIRNSDIQITIIITNSNVKKMTKHFCKNGKALYKK